MFGLSEIFYLKSNLALRLENFILFAKMFSTEFQSKMNKSTSSSSHPRSHGRFRQAITPVFSNASGYELMPSTHSNFYR